MKFEVVVRGKSARERRIPFSADRPLRIGRDPDCDIQLAGGLVSRAHATLHVGATDMKIEDASTNGTVAGDVRIRNSIASVPLDSQVRIGDFSLHVSLLDGPRHGRVARPRPAGEPPVAPAVRSATPAVRSPTPLPATAAPDPLSAAPAGHTADRDGDPGSAAPPLLLASAAPSASPPLLADVERDADARLRRRAHALLLENLDMTAIAPSKERDPSLRPRVLAALRKVVMSLDVPAATDRDALIGELADEALGLGPLEQYLADPSVSEIMVVDPQTIYVERMGVLSKVNARFTDDDRVRAVIERIVTPLGRRIDESSPFVDARLPDGSRVNAVIRPVALRGSCITIRKFAKTRITVDRLISLEALTVGMARFLHRSVVAKKNIVVSGGTGSGKTTLLNVLSEAIPEEERVVTIEDAAELQLKQPHVVSMETRPANMEGKGGYSIRDLVKNALRMRPDRIVVGECRGGEALDMLQAMNTGHEGSLTTTHANSPREAIARLETLVLMAGIDLPSRAIREQIAGAVHLLVQQTRFSDGSRKVTNISEVTGINDEGQIDIVPLFQFTRTGTGAGGKILGEFRPTGFLPSFLQDFIVMGLVKPGEPYL